MEYLVTMTTHVPEGTPERAVENVPAREAARSRELAAQGYLPRRWQAGGPAEMQAMLRSLPLDPWMTVQTTPLSSHPSDPAGRS